MKIFLQDRPISFVLSWMVAQNNLVSTIAIMCCSIAMCMLIRAQKSLSVDPSSSHTFSKKCQNLDGSTVCSLWRPQHIRAK